MIVLLVYSTHWVHYNARVHYTENTLYPCSTKTSEVLYPYTAEKRDVMENTLTEAHEISQGRGFCTPRPEGNLEGRGTTNAMQCITLQCDDILPACKCLHCTYLHHFPRKDVFLIFVLGSVSKILSLVHSLESRECIGYYDL